LQIPKSTENKDWWQYIDENLTFERIQSKFCCNRHDVCL
jgi:hypothetical protein